MLRYTANAGRRVFAQCALLQRAAVPTRAYSTPTIQEVMKSKIPKHNEKAKAVKQKYGDLILGTCTVEQAYGGMRSVKSMTWETSLLDAEEGIKFRGYNIPQLQKGPSALPKAEGGEEPLPEALLWLLLTGDVPTLEETRGLEKTLMERAALPAHATALIDAFPKQMHPMAQLTAAVLGMQQDSEFAAAYQRGIHKKDYWEPTLEDALTLIARLPSVAARIYRNVYRNGDVIESDHSLDLGANYAKMLGFDSHEFAELMRLYLVIHSDHEGGNVSAHATRLVGSALSDPYLAFAGGMTGLAGPLHGLANQEVLTWLLGVQEEIGLTPSDADVEKHLWDTLNSGRVVPGYGHAVLRQTDPRYMAQREFALKHLPNDPLFKLVSQVYEIAPRVLTEHGKAKNPFPNVDAHSGCLLVHYGLTEQHYYTVMFGISRAIGVLSSLVWDRAMMLPLERPKSVTTDWILDWAEKQEKK